MLDWDLVPGFEPCGDGNFVMTCDCGTTEVRHHTELERLCDEGHAIPNVCEACRSLYAVQAIKDGAA